MLDAIIYEAIDVAVKAQHRREQIDIELFDRACTTSDGLGVITLLVGVANWGIRVPRVPIVEVGKTVDGYEDPAQDGWRGRPAALGKHLTDYSRGGLGLPHIDSTNLRTVYQDWGSPPCGSPELLTDFNAILRSRHASAWLGWARDLSQDPDWWTWCFHWWLDWCWRDPRVQQGTPAARVMRARIRNSRPAILRRAAPGMGFDDLAKLYIAHTPNRDRTERQISYCRRIKLLLERRPLSPPTQQ